MNPEQQRYRHHTQADPQLRFWLLKSTWTSIDAASVSDDDIRQSRAGLVTYPSGEVLCYYGKPPYVPKGVHFMDGPTYSDNKPGFRRSLVRNGDGGVQVSHGMSRSQTGDPRYYYSTEVVNLTEHRVRVTKFAPFLRGLFGIKRDPPRGYYSPVQFREWFRVNDPEGWILPRDRVCDPDNYGRSNGVWAYFFETEQGDRFIATAPLEHDAGAKKR